LKTKGDSKEGEIGLEKWKTGENPDEDDEDEGGLWATSSKFGRKSEPSYTLLISSPAHVK
jgi:hypothetical protein